MTRKHSDLKTHQQVFLTEAELRAVLLALDCYVDILRHQSSHRRAADGEDANPERAHILSAAVHLRSALRDSIHAGRLPEGRNPS